jgi:hypothetical protein
MQLTEDRVQREAFVSHDVACKQESAGQLQLRAFKGILLYAGREKCFNFVRFEGAHSSVLQDCSLLECYAMSKGYALLTA